MNSNAGGSGSEFGRLAREIAQLPQQGLALADFLRELLQRLVLILDAPAGAVWILSSQGEFQIQHQISLERVGLDGGQSGERFHNQLLREMVRTRQAVLLPSESAILDRQELEIGISNPTEFVILLAPIFTKENVSGALEVFQSPNHPLEAQRGFLQFLVNMAHNASKFISKNSAAVCSDHGMQAGTDTNDPRVVGFATEPANVELGLCNKVRNTLDNQMPTCSLEIKETTSSEKEVKLRGRARKRSLFCPGAGFALLGHQKLAAFTFFALSALMIGIVWLSRYPNIYSLLSSFAAIVLLGTLGVIEYFGTMRLAVRIPRPAFLVQGFFLCTAMVWSVAFLVLVVFLNFFGCKQLSGNGMLPTLEKGEHFVYHKSIDSVSPGTMLVYRIAPESVWPHAGEIAVGRVLAGPGDQISIKEKNYIVNGKPGPLVTDTQPFDPVVAVPSAPEAITVPKNSYFVVQDSPLRGYDSRVLSWVNINDVISTRVYYLRPRTFLNRVK